MPSTRFVQLSPFGFRVENVLAANHVDDTGPAVGSRRNASVLGEGSFCRIRRYVAQNHFRDVLSRELRLPHGAPGLSACGSVI